MLDDAKAEIMERAKRAGGKDAKPEPTTRSKQKRDMTKEEREAYIQKKRAEEEARLLKKANSATPDKDDRPKRLEKPTRKKRKENDADKERKAGEPEAPRRRERKNKGDSCPIRPLEPLVPLHLLKIPGLPEGDFLAICYVKGGGK